MTATNPFEFEDGDENEERETPAGDSNQNFADLRKFAKARDKAAKEAEKELERLRAFEAEVVSERKEKAIASAFEEAGLNPQHTKLYKALNPDITPDAVSPEAVASFAAEYGLVTAAGVPAEVPEEKPAGFTPFTSGQGSPAAELGKLTIEDAQKLIREGKYDEAQKLYKEGRVEKLPRGEDGSLNVDWLEGFNR